MKMHGKLTRERVSNKISRELVGRFGIPPAWFGYRYLRPKRPDELETVEAATTSAVPLPCNVASRDDLSRDTRITGFSFWDVPHRTVQPTTIGIVRDCRILAAPDEWGDLHYAIIGADDRVLEVRGTHYERRFHAPLMRTPSAARIAKATWILEAWDRNYAHWVQWHLTKIVLLQKLGRAENVILPPTRGFVGTSVAMLGLTSHSPIPATVTHVDELTVVGMDSYRTSLLTDLRQRLAGAPGIPSRKLYISRRDASRRRLVEEDRCWDLLEARGYTRVFMEDYEFRRQVTLMSDAAVVVALHGAGLANILFAPTEAHVVEVADVTFPNPQYYALSGALGQPYWLLHAQAADDLKPDYHDLSIDLAEFERVLDRVDNELVNSRPTNGR